MPISPGQSLLHYRLVDKIGEGGMGQVWKARDTTLDREVAIKILPEAFSQDPDRLARFEREAKLLASLNHPNIAAIYGLHFAHSAPSTGSGQASSGQAGIHFLSLELVPGEDLAQQLVRGPLPINQALPVAKQIAEALEAAHEQGVIHRDLKPANVKLTPDGKVKVLDFGLAKALESAPGSAPQADPSMSPTVTSAGSIAGVILGTAAYMSPEQARGQPVDRRTDIWAFGCVLYEMLTGRRAFEGATISDTLASVLAREPDWSAWPDAAPRSIRRLADRCLDKDAQTRLRDIGEARISLTDPQQDEPPRQPAPPAPTKRWPERLALLTLIAILAGTLAWWTTTRRTPPSPLSTEAMRPFKLKRLTELSGPELHPDLSPDGRMLIYDSAVAGNRDVYLLRVGGARAINLTAGSNVDDTQAKFSPDGDRIAFRSERDGGGLFVMGATGESVRRVTDFGYDPAWSPDGTHLVFGTEPVDDPYARSVISTLWTVEIDTGETTRLLETDAVQPAWSPNGQRVAFWANTGGQRDIWTVSASGGEPVPITQDLHTDWSPTWSPDGRWLYFSSDRGGSMDLWRVAIDPTSGRTLGEPLPVSIGVRSIGYAGLSADGSRMVIMAYDRTSDLAVHRLDDSSPPAVLSTTTLRRQSFIWCMPSPDGARIACTIRGAQEDIVVFRVDGSDLGRLTDDVYKDRVPRWSPDGKRLAFHSTRGGEWSFRTIHADGSELRQLTDLGEVTDGTWSPDSRRLIVTSNHLETFLVDADRLNTRDTAELLEIAGDNALGAFAWSADGTRLAGVVVDPIGMAKTINVLELKSLEQHMLDLEPSGQPLGSVAGWLPDSRRLIARSGTSAVLYDTATDRQHEILEIPLGATLNLSYDGRALLIENEVFDSEIWLLTFE